MPWKIVPARIVAVGCFVALQVASLVFETALFAADAVDWPNWRGPEQNRISRETGLVDSFDIDSGENIVWKSEEAAGISSPIVMNGKVYLQVRHKPETKQEQEKVICLDAATGQKLWDNAWNVYLSDVPAERVGWSNVCGDPETGRVFSQGVNGYFSCIDGETGKTVWSRSMHEEFGLLSTYGGRTHTPVVWEDLVFVNGVVIGWGEMAQPAHAILALDKNTGEVRWFNRTKPRPEDTVYSTPTLTVLGGVAALVVGSSDGAVWAFQPRTGKPLWNFQMSRRGLNISPTVVGDKVYMSQAEENLDNSTMGALVCINGLGQGDITKTGELWRLPKVMAGKAGPLVVDGRVYVADDSGNLYVVDAETGKLIGNKPTKMVGTIVRGSPLFADGKLFVCSTTAWNVFEPTATGVKAVQRARLPAADEVTGSIAVSHGRIYLPTGHALYCIGRKDAKTDVTPRPEPLQEAELKVNAPAWVQVTPNENLLKPGEKLQLKVRLYNAIGQLLGDTEKAEFTVAGAGTVDANGVFTAPEGTSHAAAIITAKVGGVTGQARVRIVPPLPWKFDFNDIALAAGPTGAMEGEPPLTWVGARYRHKVREKDGEKVMVKVTTIPKGTRSQSWMGHTEFNNYTIQADLCAGRRVGAAPASDTEALPTTGAAVTGMPDMGVIAQRYTLDLMGNSQQLQIRSWPPQVRTRFVKEVPFAWKPETWYTMKFRAAVENGKAVLRGKVWPRGEKEPDAWTIEAVDDVPNVQGSPGLFGQSSTAEIYIDNITVTPNEPQTAAK